MRERVVVAMSGGVDSSVAAALLVEQGFDVVGVMLRLWAETPSPLGASGLASARDPQPGPLPARERGALAVNKCCSVEAVYDAQGVADRLGIPFYVVSVEQPFKAQVVDFFVAEYAAGRTPNPCLACNRQIRFGFLLDYARKLGAHYLATGHYARVRQGDDGAHQLWRGVDRAKDQSYVLSVLGQAELAQRTLPGGRIHQAAGAGAGGRTRAAHRLTHRQPRSLLRGRRRLPPFPGRVCAGGNAARPHSRQRRPAAGHA